MQTGLIPATSSYNNNQNGIFSKFENLITIAIAVATEITIEITFDITFEITFDILKMQSLDQTVFVLLLSQNNPIKTS